VFALHRIQWKCGQKVVGVPKEAFRDAARTCTMQDEEDEEVQTT
jgi:hypothetical protein